MYEKANIVSLSYSVEYNKQVLCDRNDQSREKGNLLEVVIYKIREAMEWESSLVGRVFGNHVVSFGLSFSSYPHAQLISFQSFLWYLYDVITFIMHSFLLEDYSNYFRLHDT